MIVNYCDGWDKPGHVHDDDELVTVDILRLCPDCQDAYNAPVCLDTERIMCPQCQHEQNAEVWQGEDHPWPVYVHTCEGCEYLITESEWNQVPARQ